MKTVEKEGKTVEEAIEAALEELAVTREQVQVEILEEKSKGLFGLGGRTARVRVSLRGSGSEKARDILVEMLSLMGLPSSVSTRDEAGEVFLEIQDSHDGLLIGKKAQTLSALQVLVSLILNRSVKDGRVRLHLDVEGYRGRQEKRLTEIAKEEAAKVRNSGEAYSFEPMDPIERRIIHLALKDEPGILTESQGEGSSRRVVVKPAEK